MYRVITNTVQEVTGVRLVSPDDPNLSCWLYINPITGSIVTGDVYMGDAAYIPLLKSIPLRYTNTLPAIVTTWPASGVSYTNIQMHFDGLVGSLSEITSTNGATINIVSIINNVITFNYLQSQNSETLVITAYNSLNTDYREYNLSFSLAFVDAIPTSLSPYPNTRIHTYTNIAMNFTKAIDSVGSVVSSAQGALGNVNTNGNQITFDYTTPNIASDTLTFYGIISYGQPNTFNPTFSVTGIMTQPLFSSWALTPTSQSYSYTGLRINFTKPLSNLTNVTVSQGTLSAFSFTSGQSYCTFNWTSAPIANATFTFQNMVGLDNTVDASGDGPEHTILQNLGTSPTSILWVGQQPFANNTTYNNIRVDFAQPIVAFATLTAAGQTITNITHAANSATVTFNVVTNDNPDVEYTFTSVVALDGGLADVATIAIGPNLKLVEVNKDLMNANLTNYVADNNIVVDYTCHVRLTFSKALQTVGTFTCGSNCTVTQDFTPGTIYVLLHILSTVQGTQTITFPSMTATDSTIMYLGNTFDFNVLPSITAPLSLRYVSDDTAVSTIQGNIQTNLYLVSNKNIAAVQPDLTITFPDTTIDQISRHGSILNRLLLQFESHTTQNNIPITITGLQDVDGFYYQGNIITQNISTWLPGVTITAKKVLKYGGTYQTQSPNLTVPSNTKLTIVFVFNKSIDISGGIPTVVLNGSGNTLPTGTASTTTYVNDTITFTDIIFNNATTLTFNAGIIGADTSVTTSSIVTNITLVSPITFVRIERQDNPGVACITATPNINVAYNAIFSGAAISPTMTGVGISATLGGSPTGLAYSSATKLTFSWSPNTTGNATIAFTNMRDTSDFVYDSILDQNMTLIYPGVIINEISWSVDIAYREYGVVSYGIQASTDGSNWVTMKNTTAITLNPLTNYTTGQFSNSFPYQYYRFYTISNLADNFAIFRINHFKAFTGTTEIPSSDFANTARYQYKWQYFTDDAMTTTAMADSVWYPFATNAILSMNYNVWQHEYWGSNSSTHTTCLVIKQLS